MNLALTLEQAGKTDEALATYRTALEVWPGHIGTVQALARLEVVSGRRSDDLAGLSWRHIEPALGAALADTRVVLLDGVRPSPR